MQTFGGHGSCLIGRLRWALRYVLLGLFGGELASGRGGNTTPQGPMTTGLVNHRLRALRLQAAPDQHDGHEQRPQTELEPAAFGCVGHAAILADCRARTRRCKRPSLVIYSVRGKKSNWLRRSISRQSSWLAVKFIDTGRCV